MSQALPTEPRAPQLEDNFLMLQPAAQEGGLDVIPDDWNRGAPDHPSDTTTVRTTSGAR